MKIVIAYPPLESAKGIPLLGQNRQFQWAKTPWNAYPIVPAYGASLLKQAGYQVAWLDGITAGWSFENWLAEFSRNKADVLVIETKTPVVKLHWQIIDKLKNKNPKLKIALAGDHVTALPEESMKQSRVDYILTGGDYDWLMLNLADYLSGKAQLEPGIYYRQGRKIVNTGKFVLNHNLDKLPFIDRELTDWRLYAYKNSNYSRTPGTYTMFGRDCWWGKCSFCSWTTLFPGQSYRTMSVKRALAEISYTLEKIPVREIMDDSGTFPVGDWLTEFCQGMIRRKYQQQLKFDCNMRFNNSLVQKDYNLMAKAGFRFLLYGLESANQKTLDRLNKNLRVAQIEAGLKMAKKAGLWPHITVMIGYPWETKAETLNTLNLARRFFKQGLVESLQVTLVIPYPGTPLFDECSKAGWLETIDWNRYDMKEPVMKSKISDREIMQLINSVYSSFWSPQFIWRKLKEGLTSWDRFKYYFWLGIKYFGKRLDFSKRN